MSFSFFEDRIETMGLNSRIKSIFWRIDDSNTDGIHRHSIKPFENCPLNFSDPRVNEAVGHHNKKWFHNEVVVKAANATVEPQYGYAITGLRTIVGASIRTRDNLPSPIPMLRSHFMGKNRELKKAILFDGSMGINYFHFLSDVLHKVYLLEQHFEIDHPFLVGSSVFSKPFFQFIIKETELRKYDWQEITQPVKVKELYVARPMPYGKEYWLRTKELLVSKDAFLSERKAIFINRKETRHITNFSEIEPILTEFNIEEFDPGNMNMKQQAQLFNTATHVIGIHGAGMTNVAFCNHEKVKVLELCSNNRIGTQYYWLCASLGIDWNMLLGGVAEADQSFALDPEEFRKALGELFAN